MDDRPHHAPRRWEYIASGVVTALSAAALAVSVDFQQLEAVVRQLPAPPGWLESVVGVPQPVWWVTCAVTAGLLFWLGVVLSRKWGSVALFIAPVVLVALSFAVPWLLYGPVRDALPTLSS